MYAEFHPVYNKLLIFSEEPIGKPNTQSMLHLNTLLSAARLYPNRTNAELIKNECRKIYGENDYRIEVWKPRFDVDSCRFWLVKENEY